MGQIKAEKYCPKCTSKLPVESFAVNRSTSSGYQSYCRTCWRTYRTGRKAESYRPLSSDYKQATAGAYSRAQASAKRRGYSFELSARTFDRLVRSRCTLCGLLATDLTPFHFAGRTIDRQINGLDRIDSDMGYTVANVQTLCAECNYRKGTSRPGRLLDHAFRIVEWDLFGKHDQPPTGSLLLS